MNENTTSAQPQQSEQPASGPLQLGRRNRAAITAMRQRIAPDAIPDGGMSPLDVAAFCSSI